MSLNSVTYRRNNFNFWPIEDSLIGRPVYCVGRGGDNYLTEKFEHRRLAGNGAKPIEDYFSFSRVLIDDIGQATLPDKKIALSFHTVVPENYFQHFKTAPYDTCGLYVTIYQDKKVTGYIPLNITVKDLTGTRGKHIATIRPDLPPGRYDANISISNCLPGHPSINSSGFRLKVR